MNGPRLLDECENICLLRLANLNILYLNLNYYHYLLALFIVISRKLIDGFTLCSLVFADSTFPFFFSVLKIYQATLPSSAYTREKNQIHLLPTSSSVLLVTLTKAESDLFPGESEVLLSDN